MKPSMVDTEPLRYFAETNINESVILEIDVTSQFIEVVIAFAGDALVASKVQDLTGVGGKLPLREFKDMQFEGIRNCIMIDNRGATASQYGRQSKLWAPGPAVIYGVRIRASGQRFCFACCSNKFESLSFEFERLKTATLVAQAVQRNGAYIYKSVEDGSIIDFHDPFSSQRA